MKLIDLIPHFAKMNVYRDKDNKAFYFHNYTASAYITLPIEVFEKARYHEIVKVFKWLTVAVIYGTVFTEEWK